VTAVRLLIRLEREAAGEVASLKPIAEELDESPTYLTKIARYLVRAGILRAQRGKAGGVALSRIPQEITLLAITEACQGAVLGNFCQQTDDLSKTCAFHRAGAELHDVTIHVLSRWTLADFCRQPAPTSAVRGKLGCLLDGWRPGQIMPAQKRKR
jgi:Rrf2 family protein